MVPLLAALFATLTPERPAPPPVYSGRENQIHIRVPRIESDATIDGRLAEAVWVQAALLTGFSQFSPQDGIPSADSTEVLVWYSPTAIYFGIRAFEKHGPVHASLADRDKIAADDNMQILLGPFHDQRQAMVFGVNPFGVQMDGTIAELGQSLTGGWNGAVAARVSADLSQDFVFTSKGRLTDYGFEVEIRIPFKSLKYQADDEQSWDINVVRQVQHSGYEDTWAPAKREKPSFLAQSGSIDGLRGLDRGLVLDLSPVVTQKITGAPAADGWQRERGNPQVGANVRWGITNNLTLNGTARPDFAEVESDAGQFVTDPRRALYFAERRPFFLDGLDQFIVPNTLIYTRRIVRPDAAVKLSGKISGNSIAVLSGIDDPSVSPTGRDRAFYNIVRAQRDLGSQSRLGVAYTDREVGSDFNRVADIDGQILLGGPYSLLLQGAGSQTRQNGKELDGPLWSATFSRSGKNFGLRYLFSGIDPDFQAQSGFISRAGIVHGALDQHWSWFGERGAGIDNFTFDLVLDDMWQYDNFLRRGDAQDKKAHFNTSTALRGGWSVGASVFWETFGFDNQLYAGYAVERTPGDTVNTLPFTGTPRIPNRDYVITLNTPQFKQFNGNLLYIWGQDENFFEWAQADIHFIQSTVSFRPTEQLRIDGTSAFQDYIRRTDRSSAGKNVITRLKLEYQLNRAIFVRVVGEYDLAEHDDLRDETRTFLPLTINGHPALASKSVSFHQDFLFSYRPSPGTVLFLGYGSQVDAPPDLRNRFVYQPLVRDADHFFLKLSYLFSM